MAVFRFRMQNILDIGTQYHGATMITPRALNRSHDTRARNLTPSNALSLQSLDYCLLRAVLLER